MLFCPKCKAILTPKKTTTGKTKMACLCGYSTKEKEKLILKEKITVDKKDEIK